MTDSFDLIILGGGAGGLFAASVANTLGARTCIVEKKRLGGDCTWYGCMPSKAILRSGQVAHFVRRLSEFGLKLPEGFPIQTNAVMSHVRDVVRQIAAHHDPEDLEKRGIKVILGAPRFLDGQTVQVNGKTISAKRMILATGSHPIIPPIEGLKNIPYLTNETIFDLDELPKSMIVLGGGPIGLELSQALNRLGVKVTIVEMLPRILIREEEDLARVLEKQLGDEGIQILAGHKAVKAHQESGEIILTVEDSNQQAKDIRSEKILAAVGRGPNVEGLDLEKAGVAYSRKGIQVDPYLRTTNPRIFACGDAAGPYPFSHMAAYQAGTCVRNALFKRIVWQKVNYSNVPWATFTDPELAHHGMTESEARAKYSDVRVYTTPYSNSDRAVTDVHSEGLLKVITDKRGLILGAHVVGAEAGEIIQGLIVAKSQKIPLAKLARTIYIYPTLSELVKKTAAKPLVASASHPLIKFVLKVMRGF